MSACGEAPPPRATALEQARKAYAAGLFVEAEQQYEAALTAQLLPEARWEAWTRLVELALNQRGDPQRAISLLARMRAEYAADPQRLGATLSRLGEAYAALGLHKLAVECWAQAEALPGVEPRERMNLALRQGRAWRTMGRFPKAEEAAARCREAAGPRGLDDPKSLAVCDYERALALSFTERFADARPILEKLVTDERLGGEERGVAAFLLADVLARQNQFALARQLLMAIRPAHPNPLAVDARLRALDQQERQSRPAGKRGF